MSRLKKIVLGTVQMGVSGYGINNHTHGLSVQESLEILAYASQVGINTLDTASAYGNAEEIIGKSGIEQGTTFDIITKIDPQSKIAIDEALAQSLSRLGAKSIDTLMFHSFEDFERKKGRMPLLLNEQEKGRIKKIGVSIYTEQEARDLLKEDEINTIQLPFNLLDNSSRKEDLFNDLKVAGKTIHVRSVFLQGLFFKNALELPDVLKPLIRDLETLDSLSQEYEVSMNKMAIGYALSKTQIDGVIIGVDSLGQLKDNVKDISEPLSSELVEGIDQIRTANTTLLNPVNWS